MTSGGLGVHGNPSANFPGPASITGHLDPTTGAITGGTFSTVSYHESGHLVTTSTETVIVSQITPGAGTGTVNYLGDLSYTAKLQVVITIHSPVEVSCHISPIDVLLTSSTPYSSRAVTISESDFTIPNVNQTVCPTAAEDVNARFTGKVNEMSLSLEGALPLPAPPATPTVTSLTVSPAGPVLVGTPVTLTASVSATGSLASNATGTVSFKSGLTTVATATVSGGKAKLTTAALPARPDQSLTAVFSGDDKYATSTSSPVTYSVQPKPTVSTSLPVTVIRGTAVPTSFAVTVTNPSTGASWPNLVVQLKLSDIQFQQHTNITLTYEDQAHVWCSLPLRHTGTIKGTFKGFTGTCGSTTNFSLAPGTQMTIPFRIRFATRANLGTQTVGVALFTVAPTGTVIKPFTTTTTTGTPNYAPYALSTIQINPSTKYSLTTSATPTPTTVPQGWSVFPNATFTPPASTTATKVYYPTPSGTVRYLVTGHTFTPPVVTTTPRPIVLENIHVSTSGLSVGTHTLTAEYSGDGVYNAASVTSTFKVEAAASGTSLACDRNGNDVVPGSVVAFAALPPTTNSGSATARPVNLTVHLDQTSALTGTNPSFDDLKVSFTPGGSLTSAPAVPSSHADDITTITWTGLSTTIPVTGSPGTVVPIGISSFSMITTTGGGNFVCTATPKPVPLGSVLVSGLTLSASPASPVAPGTTVTLKATVVPATRRGQVSFFDGSTNLGTVPVPTSGATTGVVTLKIQPALGVHSFSAQWSGTSPPSTSNTVAYSVETAPVVTTQPTPPTANLGKPLTFTAAATGNPSPTVTWQQSTNGGTTWTKVKTILGPLATTLITTKVSGTKTTSTLTIPSATKTDGNAQYRAVFTNSAGTAATDAVTPNVVIPPAVVTQPANQSVVAGSAGSFTAAATGSVVAVQWQISTDGGKTWSNAPGTPKTTYPSRTTVTSTYTTPVTTTANNGAEYRAHFSNGAGTATSNAATLTVTAAPPPPVAPVVTTQPASTTVNAGTTVVFSATASGLPTPSVQWQVSSNGGGSWSSVPGATSDLLVLTTVPGTDNANQYRAVFTNSAGSATSKAATLTVNVNGYRLVASNGSVFSYGTTPFYGSMGGKTLSAPIVGTASTPGDGGYWLVGSDGGIFSFGDAHYYGSMGGQPLNKPIVGMASTPTGGGYWEVASDGGIFAFGNAKFYGSTGSMTLNKPIVGMATTPTGGGYWLVASDGGIFAFGNATFYGSTGSMTLNKPIVGMAAAPTGGGYWLVASDGGIFSFGNAQFHGAAVGGSGAGTTTSSIMGLSVTPTGGGYWEAASSGQVFQFGDATSAGTALTQTATIVGISG